MRRNNLQHKLIKLIQFTINPAK